MRDEPVIPPPIEDVADAVSRLLDPEMDMAGIKENPQSVAASNDLKTRYEYKIREVYPQH